jgi:hypothetical protein
LAVGGIDTEALSMAAQLGALGIDPMRFLETKDPFERNLLIELASKISEYKTKMDHNLAVDIANSVGKLFKS